MIRRRARVMVGVLVLGGAGMLLTPHALHTISESAVVNAPVTSIKAPFDGTLAAHPRQKGDPIPLGYDLVVLEAQVEDRDELARLAARSDYLEREIMALAEERETLQRLDADMAARDQAVHAVAADVLMLDLAVLESQVEAARHQAEHLDVEANRLERLLRSGTISLRQHEDASNAARTARAALTALEAQRDRAARQVASMEDGTLPAFGTEDGSYARQRRDEIAIRIADLTTRHALARAEADRVRAERSALENQLALRGRFAPRNEGASLAWTASPDLGGPVARGDEILQVLDCSRRFLEVTLPEGRYASIDVGEEASIRLKGSDAPFLASVTSIQGAGAIAQTGRLAAQPPRTADSHITVTLALPPADVTDPETAARYCDVGRTAQVRFERDGVHRVTGEVAQRWSALQTLSSETFAGLQAHLRRMSQTAAAYWGPVTIAARSLGIAVWRDASSAVTEVLNPAHRTHFAGFIPPHPLTLFDTP